MGFGKDENGRRADDNIIIYMGKNVEIKGSVHFEGAGRIDGKIEGKVSVKGSLILGEGAVISSEVEGDTIVVGGKVNGKMVAHQRIQLLKTSVFTGEMIAPSIIIEEGAQFNGTCKMTQTAPLRHAPFEEEETVVGLK